MSRYIFHYIKWLRSLLMRPIKTIRWFYEDLKKDRNSKKFNSNFHKVWCAGLPKSGTTLIEKIFDFLPYVKLNNSILRTFNTDYLEHDHAISNTMFQNIDNNKYTFFKSHTHYDKKYEDIAIKNDLKVIVSLRDLRDMLISRYFHIMNDEKHWLHQEIKKKNFTDGFICSLKLSSKKGLPNALNYYYYWILNWQKIAKQKNYLVLWYEEYKANPSRYIEKILEYVEFDQFSKFEIEKNLNQKRISNNSLKEKLKNYGRLKDTFRKGEVNEWNKYFNKSISNYFHENIPDKIEKITYENFKK